MEGSEPFRGAKTSLRLDRVRMPGIDGSEVVSREYMEHPGAVAAVALDGDGRVLLLSQYRHPVRHRMWELPAGIRDEAGEPPVRTAQRELLEEAGYRADHWHELVGFFPSTGFSSERIQVYLARGLTKVPDAEVGFHRVHEEADMELVWLPLEDALTAVMADRIHNAATVIGVLSASIAARDGFATLTPAAV
ncbi:MAG: NUDIX hydrolase [Nocardiopsaceae bacterium]|nr:NUDIX hydrolase [Nocardiopsaceae bacterium]